MSEKRDAARDQTLAALLGDNPRAAGLRYVLLGLAALCAVVWVLSVIGAAL